MMKTKITLGLFILQGLAIAVLFYVQFGSHAQLAYVDTSKLLAGYTSMQQAQNAYQVKMATWQPRFDFLSQNSFLLRNVSQSA